MPGILGENEVFMIDFVYKRRGVTVNAVWFAGRNYADIIKNSCADIVFFHGIDDPGLKNSVVMVQKTLKTDLRQPPEKIFAEFGSTCRNGIRRAEREGITFSYYNAAALIANPRLMAEFRREFDEFSRIKGIENLFNPSAMARYIDKGGAVLTKASKDGIDYVQHVLVTDGSSARLLHSVSKFRDQQMDRNLTGNANRLLHWKEMEYMRSLGLQMYDWGGITDDQKPNGVDFFKMEFHGLLTPYNNVLVGKNLKGKVVIFIIKRLWRNESSV